jgi:hypothetical protein
MQFEGFPSRIAAVKLNEVSLLSALRTAPCAVKDALGNFMKNTDQESG